MLQSHASGKGAARYLLLHALGQRRERITCDVPRGVEPRRRLDGLLLRKHLRTRGRAGEGFHPPSTRLRNSCGGHRVGQGVAVRTSSVLRKRPLSAAAAFAASVSAWVSRSSVLRCVSSTRRASWSVRAAFCTRRASSLLRTPAACACAPRWPMRAVRDVPPLPALRAAAHARSRALRTEFLHRPVAVAAMHRPSVTRARQQSRTRLRGGPIMRRASSAVAAAASTRGESSARMRSNSVRAFCSICEAARGSPFACLPSAGGSSCGQSKPTAAAWC